MAVDIETLARLSRLLVEAGELMQEMADQAEAEQNPPPPLKLVAKDD